MRLLASYRTHRCSPGNQPSERTDFRVNGDVQPRYESSASQVVSGETGSPPVALPPPHPPKLWPPALDAKTYRTPREQLVCPSDTPSEPAAASLIGILSCKRQATASARARGLSSLGLLRVSPPAPGLSYWSPEPAARHGTAHSPRARRPRSACKGVLQSKAAPAR